MIEVKTNQQQNIRLLAVKALSEDVYKRQDRPCEATATIPSGKGANSYDKCR